MQKDNPNQTPGWNRFWSQHSTAGQKPGWAKKRIISVLNPYLQKHARVIDAGCGSGFFSHFFMQSDMQVIAIDNSPAALDLCRVRCNENTVFSSADLLNDNLADIFGNNNDLVFSDGLLEHFSPAHQIRILQNFAGATNPAGHIVTFVPNLFSPWQLIRPFVMPGILETPFTLKRLLRLHDAANLEVISSGGINVIPASFSPERLLGSYFGMLLYVVSRKKKT